MKKYEVCKRSRVDSYNYIQIYISNDLDDALNKIEEITHKRGNEDLILFEKIDININVHATKVEG